jgi:hypothetical protein
LADFGKIREEGSAAYNGSAPQNPYRDGTSSARAWLAGWENMAMQDNGSTWDDMHPSAADLDRKSEDQQANPPEEKTI